jgi:hypothetical protein
MKDIVLLGLMPSLPRSFLIEIERARIRMQAEDTHLLLLNRDSLAWLERWRAERHWRRLHQNQMDALSKTI